MINYVHFILWLALFGLVPIGATEMCSFDRHLYCFYYTLVLLTYHYFLAFLALCTYDIIVGAKNLSFWNIFAAFVISLYII